MSIKKFPKQKIASNLPKDFAVFILTHGRADNVKTISALKRGNYTGKTYLVIDDEDDTAEEYYKRYGKENVIVFSKDVWEKRIDVADNFKNRKCVVYARNAVFEIAKELGYKYFLVLDDDYSKFVFRKAEARSLKTVKCDNLNRLFHKTIDFLEVSGAVTVAYGQGGDFIGGVDNGNFHKGILRKAMNSFFCSTERPFQFYGTINEDVTAYVYLGSQGKLFFTITAINIFQEQTQKNKGGLTDIYLDLGTYVKSFYSVMYSPSCVKVSPMGTRHMRLHHKVSWNNAVPKIIREEYKKVKENG